MLDRESAIELLIERFEEPAFRGRLPVPPAVSAELRNPTCGDVVTMYVEAEGDHVRRASFEGYGCTISQAAADLVAERLGGEPIAALLSREDTWVLEVLGAVVHTRVACATLASRAAKQALLGLQARTS